jgi:hypothetical protein
MLKTLEFYMPPDFDAEGNANKVTSGAPIRNQIPH